MTGLRPSSTSGAEEPQDLVRRAEGGVAVAGSGSTVKRRVREELGQPAAVAHRDHLVGVAVEQVDRRVTAARSTSQRPPQATLSRAKPSEGSRARRRSAKNVGGLGRAVVEVVLVGRHVGLHRRPEGVDVEAESGGPRLAYLGGEHPPSHAPRHPTDHAQRPPPLASPDPGATAAVARAYGPPPEEPNVPNVDQPRRSASSTTWRPTEARLGGVKVDAP